MAFQVKDFISIVAGMVNHARSVTKKLTDFNVGSVNRTIVECSAIEIDELYQQMVNGLIESIPVAIYLSFDFDKVLAAAAATDITFTASPAVTGSPVIIPKDTAVRIPAGPVGFITDTEVSIPVGQTTVTVRAAADTVGIVGNTLANTITSMDAPIATISVTNSNAVISGRDIETDTQRKVRFGDYIESISRGPLKSIEFGAKTATIKDSSGNVTEYVAKSKVIEPYITDSNQPLGYINCYIYNGVNTASAALIAEAQKIINGYVGNDGKRVLGWKGSGIICTVAAIVALPINVTAVLAAKTGFLVADLTLPVDESIRDYFMNLEINEEMIYTELVKRILTVPGVYDVVLTTPTANVTVTDIQKVTPGVLSIS